MSSSRGKSHSMSNVFELGGSIEPSPVRASSSDYEEEDISFRVVRMTRQAVSSSALASPLASVVVVPWPMPRCPQVWLAWPP